MGYRYNTHILPTSGSAGAWTSGNPRLSGRLRLLRPVCLDWGAIRLLGLNMS
jgi:hypothetical protein